MKILSNFQGLKNLIIIFRVVTRDIITLFRIFGQKFDPWSQNFSKFWSPNPRFFENYDPLSQDLSKFWSLILKVFEILIPDPMGDRSPMIPDPIFLVATLHFLRSGVIKRIFYVTLADLTWSFKWYCKKNLAVRHICIKKVSTFLANVCPKSCWVELKFKKFSDYELNF